MTTRVTLAAREADAGKPIVDMEECEGTVVGGRWGKGWAFKHRGLEELRGSVLERGKPV